MTLNRLQHDRAATDPILIIAGIAITLILLVGGVFAVSGFVANAQDLNARGDLERISVAQASRAVEDQNYGRLALGPLVLATERNGELLLSPIAFTPGARNTLIVSTCDTGWVALGYSESGAAYIRTSMSSATFDADMSDVASLNIVSGASIPACLSMTVVAQDWLNATT